MACSKDNAKQNQPTLKSAPPSTEVVYEIPTDPDQALNNVAAFEQAYESYLNGGLTAANSYEINSEYALWVFEAALNKHFHATEDEYQVEINSDSTLLNLPVTLDHNSDIGYIEGFDLLQQYEQVLTEASAINYDLAPMSNVKISNADNGTIEVTVQYARKYISGPFSPVPIGPGDNHYAKVKSKCDNSGNLNAADRLITANRGISDLQAFMWYYTVRDYELSNHDGDPAIQDIFDYRLKYEDTDPFGRTFWYHKQGTIHKTRFHDYFLGGQSVSGVPGAPTYVPGDCVNSADLQGWDDDLKYVLSQVKTELQGIASVRVWAADEDPQSTSPLTHHNCKFRGANAGLGLEPVDISLGNPILH